MIQKQEIRYDDLIGHSTLLYGETNTKKTIINKLRIINIIKFTDN